MLIGIDESDNYKKQNMKRSIIIYVSLAFLSAGLSISPLAAQNQEDKDKNAITVAATTELETLARSWIDAYRADNPVRKAATRAGEATLGESEGF